MLHLFISKINEITLSEGTGAPVYLKINSFYNDVEKTINSVFSILEILKLSGLTVFTYANSPLGVLGTTILSSGTKGHRYINKDARLTVSRVHKSSNGEHWRKNEILFTTLASNIGVTPYYFYQWFLDNLGLTINYDADGAKTFGFVDKIIDEQ